MKIRIEHAGNPLNYGTNMMVTNFMYYLDKYSGNKNEYELDVYNDEDLENYKQQYNEGIMSRKTIDYNLYYSTNIIQKILNKIKRDYFSSYYTKKNLNELCKNTESLVILGGDDLSEYYGIKSLENELYRINYIKNKMNLYLVGQTIGPFKEERITKARVAMEGVKIYSRDPWTTKYLQNDLGLKNISDSRDLAFLPLPYQENKEIEDKILNKYNLNREEYITLIPSGLYESYCPDINIYVNTWVDIIKSIIDMNPDKKIVLLSHVLRPKAGDDRNIIKKIQDKASNLDKMICIYDELTPLQARFILGNGMFTITGRMHGAISTLQMKKPAISISYSVKYNGVIGEGLGLKELIVRGEKDTLWKSGIVKDECLDKIQYIMNNYNTILEDIQIKVDECEERVKVMIEDISNNLR
ncbi:polysaccharide pyruvyl transferase family protein [Romboutsia hominis]|uniref:Polysaccharide pyruvyl transferase n=1 Tax=Romboutsia hominis TaxID=1507512 RepID=A0A2P2BSM1_9FIRM|nr:polysaccharide pyruvyl transferase family protein [Romboutsia hominis]CEI73363.1 polysaccharide pyruvyl transferase [Romboutsia hominis]